jgi:enoyl-[acyl-carrier protein] reductase II
VVVSGTESGGLRTTGPESTNFILVPLVCGDAGTTLLPIAGMAMRTIINPKMGELMASGADLAQEYNMGNAGEARSTGNFDLFPAGGGQISALISEVKPVNDIIEGLVE